jgi:hypothetical protein
MRRKAWTKGVDTRDVHRSFKAVAPPKGQKKLLGERPAHIYKASKAACRLSVP